jgi:small subunit ribosomal protein S1
MASTANPTRDDFAAMLNESLGGENEGFEGKVVKGTVTAIENDHAVIDVGLKSEGRVPLREFAMPGQKAEINVGDIVEVYVDRVENVNGEAMLSRDRARREAAWDTLETEFAKSSRVDGVIFGRVKGGFTVDLSGAVAFLPGSQVDIRPVRDVTPLMDIVQPFQILKMDRKRGNIVVSRRAILEESRAEQRTGLISTLAEGQIIEGIVKNITDYGAFVDLGGIDGLLHVTDISYKRVGHPSEIINIGDNVKVQIIRINKDTQRISLGMKQLEIDPWDVAIEQYPVGAKLTGRVTNITEYGAFVELQAGIEGLVHVSEMSWTKKNVHPGKIVSTSQEVDVIVLEVDSEKRLNIPWAARSKAKSKTQLSSACSSASMATLMAWSTCQTSPGAFRAKMHLTFTVRAKQSPLSFSISTPRRSVFRSASSSLKRVPPLWQLPAARHRPPVSTRMQS